MEGNEVPYIGDSIRCSKCGADLDRMCEPPAFIIRTTLGYGSDYDGAEIELVMCPKCADRLVSSCKIDPILPEYDLSDEECRDGDDGI